GDNAQANDNSVEPAFQGAHVNNGRADDHAGFSLEPVPTIPVWITEANSEQVFARIKHLGGKVSLYHTKSDKLAFSVDLRNTQVTEAELKLLQGLTRIGALALGSNVTDVRLGQLQGLSGLNSLSLGSSVTDI